jgi:hypothetical protein
MSSSSVIYPDFFRIVERKPGGWLIKKGTIFYKKLPIATSDLEDTQLCYGISKEQIVVELFRVNGGKLGYYLADLRHKRYYYCGLNQEDVKTMLRKLGIGRNDPVGQ